MNWRAVQFVQAPRPQTLAPWASGGSSVRSAVAITQDDSASDRVAYRISFSPDISVSDDSLAVQVCIVGEDGAASLAYIPGETLPIVGVEDGQTLDCLIGDGGPPACVYLSAPGICVGRVHVEHVRSGIKADLGMGSKKELERSGEEPIVMVARPQSRPPTPQEVEDSAVEYRDLSRDGLLLTAALTAVGAAGLRIVTGSDDAAIIPTAFGLGGFTSLLWLGSIVRRVGRLGRNQRQQKTVEGTSEPLLLARVLGVAVAAPITVGLLLLMMMMKKKQGGVGFSTSLITSNINAVVGDARGWAERVFLKLDQRDRQAAVLAFAAGLIQFRIALLVANRKSREETAEEKARDEK